MAASEALTEVLARGAWLGTATAALSAVVDLWLTRVPAISLERDIGVAVRACRGAAVGGTLVAVTSAVGLGVISATARPSAAMPAHPAVQTTSPGPAGTVASEPPGELPPGGPAVPVGPAPGGRAMIQSSVYGAGSSRVLALEVVGLDTLDDPVGWWAVCLGLPTDALVASNHAGWARFGGDHRHDEKIADGTVAGRDPGPYRTYILRFQVSERPGPERVLLPLVHIHGRQPGRHQVGVCMAKGAPKSIADFRYYRSRTVVACSGTEPTEAQDPF